MRLNARFISSYTRCGLTGTLSKCVLRCRSWNVLLGLVSRSGVRTAARRATARQTTGEDLDRGLHVDAVCLEEDDRRRDELDRAGDDELIGRLNGLARGQTWTTVLPTVSNTGRSTGA